MYILYIIYYNNIYYVKYIQDSSGIAQIIGKNALFLCIYFILHVTDTFIQNDSHCFQDTQFITSCSPSELGDLLLPCSIV